MSGTAKYEPHLPVGSPPSVWLAFVKASRWKSLALMGLFLCNAALAAALFAAVHIEPDVVVVDPDGSGTYVPRSVAGPALRAYLDGQKQKPSTLTAGHVAQELTRLLLEVNSTTIAQTFPELLAQMDAPLAARFRAQDAREHLVQGTRAAGISTRLRFGPLTLRELGGGFVARLPVCRIRSSLVRAEEPARAESLQVELVLSVVPRTVDHPDGLVLSEVRVDPIAAADGGTGGCDAR